MNNTSRSLIRNPKDVMAGLLFVAVAIILGVQASWLNLGTAARMGPGFFPLALAVLLGGLGVLVALRGLGTEGPAPSGVAWRGGTLVIGAVVLFGVGLPILGFPIAIGAVALISALGSRRFSWQLALPLATALVVLCWLVFVKGLGIPLPLLPIWIGE